MAQSTTTTDNRDAEEQVQTLLERARDLIPAIRARAAESDELRRLPEASLRDIREAGLLRVFQPAEYGGYPLPFGTQVRISEELGRGDGSAAWCFSIAVSHNWVIGMMDPRAAHDMWENDPDTIASSGSGQTGSNLATPVDGGYVVNGTFTFSSFVDHCDWILANAFVEGVDQSDTHYMLVHKSDVELLNNWHTLGMRGTGSQDIRIHDLFVPEYRSFRTGFGPGAAPVLPPADGGHAGDVYHLTTPFQLIYPYFLIGPVVGAAQGALECYCERMRPRAHASGGARLSQTPQMQLELTEAAAEIDSARLLLARSYGEINDLAARRIPTTQEQRLRFNRDAIYSARLCVRAVDRLATESGGHGLYEGNDFQRFWRDVRAGASHGALSWHARGVPYGALLLQPQKA